MADGKSYERAKSFRKALTPPEARLWLVLRRRGLEGHKFRRQHPIGPYILDFYCAAARLAVEVDGMVHAQPDQVAHDRRRTAWLKTRGVRVVRLAAEDVRVALPELMDFLAGAVSERLGTESPPPSRRTRSAATPPHQGGEETF